MVLSSKVALRVQILSVRLENSKVQCYELPSEGEAYSARVDRKVEHKFDNAGLLEVRFSLNLSAQVGEVLVSDVAATFVATYSLKDVDGLTEENFAAFAEVNGTYNIWPYCREYVQSSFQRLGLPQLVLPVLLVDPQARTSSTIQ